MEFSITLTGTMVLMFYVSALLFSMWGIEKYMKPHTTVVEFHIGDDDSSSGDGEEEENGESMDPIVTVGSWVNEDGDGSSEEEETATIAQPAVAEAEPGVSNKDD